MLIWLIAGLGLGVFLTMVAFALIVAVDMRAFRRRLRRAMRLSAPVVAPAGTVAVAKTQSAAPVAAPAVAAPAAAEPTLSIEEMFAMAFEAAVPTTPQSKPEGEQAKS